MCVRGIGQGVKTVRGLASLDKGLKLFMCEHI